ncbi:MAG: hypothetical protein WB443_11930 [Nitrososphaeraceae archaeon]
MFVDEKKAQNVSEVGENKVYMGSVAWALRHKNMTSGSIYT